MNGKITVNEVWKINGETEELFINNVLLHALFDQCFETSIRPKKSDMALSLPYRKMYDAIRKIH